jgi:hypothetical protein
LLLEIDMETNTAPLCLKPAARFFYSNAGFGWNPKTETEGQGRVRSACALAEAEALYLRATEWAAVGITWEHDADAQEDIRADIRAGRRTRRSAPESIDRAVIWHAKDDLRNAVDYLASLGAIEDADEAQRRVIRAELAQECAEELRAIIAAAHLAQ